MAYDENGFIVLTKRVEKSKKTKVKFKKGSMKAWLYKKIQKYAFSKAIEHFHNTRCENITIYTKSGKSKIIRHNERLDKATITRLTEKYPDATVLIDAGDRFYERIPFATYLKLIKIKRVAVNFELTDLPDGEEEYSTIMEYMTMLDSINDVIRFHITERTRCDTIHDIYVKDYWYSLFEMKYRVMVELKNGEIEYYKYINDFFQAYGLGVI